MTRGLGGTTRIAMLVTLIVGGCAAPQQPPQQPPTAAPETTGPTPREPDVSAMLLMMAMTDEDHSADGWSVPEGMDVRLPDSEVPAGANDGTTLADIEDPLLDALLAGAARAAPGPAAMDTRMPVLAELAGDAAEVERRLARSPA